MRNCDRCGRPLNKRTKIPRQKVCKRRDCQAEARKRAATAAHRARVAEVYGVDPGWYDRQYALQGGVCYLCRRATGASKRLAVDHNHETGEVRGLLCGPCNKVLGVARDDPEYFRRAIDYLTDPPARRLA